MTAFSLKRILGASAGAAVSVGVAVGAGVFRTPQTIAQLLPDARLMMLAWAVGGALALTDALVLAELSTFVPKAGGWYAYVRKAYGDFPAFLYGWTSSLVTYPGSVAGVALILAEYTGFLVRALASSAGWRVSYGTFETRAVAIAAILIFTAVNLAGIREAAFLQKAFAALKIAVVLLVIGVAAGASGVGTALDGERPILMSPPTVVTLAAFGVALQSVMWTYDGYADVITLAEELRNPGRDLPRALFGSVALLTVLYVALNAAFLSVLTPAQLAQANNAAAAVLGARTGLTGETVVAALVALLVIGGLNAHLISGPRITFAMARDNLSFAWLGRVNRGGAPVGALLLQAGCAVLLTLRGSFEDLVALTIFIIWLVNVGNVVAIFLFRRRHPAAERPFLMPGYPVTPALALGVSAFLLFTMLQESPRPAVTGAAVILAGVPVYWAWRRLGGKRRNERRENKFVGGD
jgi:APA family basic amino acid/polyamine antiporter